MITTITLRGNTHQCIEISEWITDKGYTHDQDYTWSRVDRNGERYILIHTREAKLATLVALQFSNLNPIQGIHPDLKQGGDQFRTETMWLGSVSHNHI